MRTELELSSVTIWDEHSLFVCMWVFVVCLSIRETETQLSVYHNIQFVSLKVILNSGFAECASRHLTDDFIQNDFQYTY